MFSSENKENIQHLEDKRESLIVIDSDNEGLVHTKNYLKEKLIVISEENSFSEPKLKCVKLNENSQHSMASSGKYSDWFI
jgi:hypothetical protein